MRANTIQFRKKCRIGNYQYDPKALVGVGVYGKVYKGVRLTDGFEVAIKVVDINQHPDKEATKFVQNQLKINQILNHEKVIHCLEIFKKNNIYYFVTQFFPEGDMEKYLKTWGPLSQQQAISLLHQVVQALIYLKKKKIIHRDIKPANIFMKEGKIKLADFGLSVFAEREIFAQELRIGTPRYMAPETLREGIYSYKGDVWSLGCLFVQMLQGEAPLSRCQSFEEVTQRVLGQMIPSTLQISADSQDLLQSIFHVCSRKRISIEQIHSHTIFSCLLKKHSSISTEDDSEIHVEDIENESLNQSCLTTRKDSFMNFEASKQFKQQKINVRTISLFQGFMKTFPKQNSHFIPLNEILTQLKSTQSLRQMDFVYVQQRIDQRIKQLRCSVNIDAQIEAIDLSYFKEVLVQEKYQMVKTI